MNICSVEKKLWLIAKTMRTRQQIKTLIKNLEDVKYYLENECIEIGKNCTWHDLQHGDIIILPECTVFLIQVR